jgi:lipid-A-disaccharide synthase
MIVTPFYNIINILLEREAVPELIQENCKSNIIAPFILGFLENDDAAKAQIKSFNGAMAQLQNGHDKPSDKAASVVLSLI